MTFHTKTQIKHTLYVRYCNRYSTVGELEKITREGRSRRMRKEVVGCVHSVVCKKKFLLQFEDGKKKEIGSCLLVYLSEK